MEKEMSDPPESEKSTGKLAKAQKDSGSQLKAKDFNLDGDSEEQDMKEEPISKQKKGKQQKPVAKAQKDSKPDEKADPKPRK